jgi:serine/threonine-protein kinase
MIGPGSKIGRFQLERSLGQGAMGTVYLAVDPDIERRVAIKVIRADGGVDDTRRDEAQSRFLKEAKLAGRLQHPNIVTIYDVGRDAGTFFIAMEYVEGQSLARLLKPDVSLTDAQKIGIIRQTAEAIAHAHERDVIHRDVKPANILVRADGVVKVSDFGIGKLLTGGAGDLTRTGQMVGSPSYMSPEQIRGEKLDGRADIFALGVVLYEMLTGERPFPGQSITTLVYQILHTEPRDPLLLRADLSPVARDILKRALAKKAEERYPNVRAFLADLDRLSAAPAGPRDSVPTTVLPPAETLAAPPVVRPGSGSHPGASTSPPAASTGSTSTVIVERRGGAAVLFGSAALVLAISALVYVVVQSRRAPVVMPAAAPRATVPSPASLTGPPASSSAPPTSVTIVPSPAASVSSAVGTPQPNSRVAEKKKPAARAPAPEPAPPQAVAAAAPPPADAAESSREPKEDIVFDNVYKTRHGMKFQISPDQARLYVDGKYVGIADDWDNHGGGKIFPFSAPGNHRVRAVLDGYRDLNLQIVVTPSAGDDAVSADDEMKKTGKPSYMKIPRPDYDTTGAVIFDPSLATAEVTVDGVSAGRASDYTAAQPLKLSGPAMHEIVLTMDGRSTRVIRILSASTSGKALAAVKEKLK